MCGGGQRREKVRAENEQKRLNKIAEKRQEELDRLSEQRMTVASTTASSNQLQLRQKRNSAAAKRRFRQRIVAANEGRASAR